tara:strand:+ start:223 stop:2208 length:1986 start_codon:yes stop_codon:yes gene_type:complete
MNMKLEDQLLASLEAQPMNMGGPVVMMRDGGAAPSQDQMALMGQAQEAVVEQAVTQDPNADIAAAIEEMMMQAQATDDPTEKRTYEHLAEAAMVGANAPMAEQAIALAAEGRGDDTALAHLRPGEVVLPPEAFEDPEFERVVQQRFEELDIDPHQAVVGLGIASLNPITGLEEFGFFKKIAKSVKKVVKKVVKPLAKVAQFIPGPWQPIAALANKAFTVYDVAKGRANPLALLTVAGPAATGGSIGSNISNITKAGGGNFFSGIGAGLTGTGAALKSGIGNLISSPVDTLFGGAAGNKGIPGLLKTATYSGEAMVPGAAATGSVLNPGQLPGAPTGMVGRGLTTAAGLGGAGMAGVPEQYQIQSGDTLSQIAQQYGVSVEEMMANNPHITDPNMIIAGQMLNVPGGQMMAGTGAAAGTGGIGGLISGGGADGVGNYGVVGDLLGGFTDKLGITNYGGAAGGTGAAGGGGGGFGGKDLAAMGLAGLLGKLAYDEAKNSKGVAQTPLTSMNAAGRYNIEAEIARRTGGEAPNPVEFGLLPANTFPTLSGGRPTPPPTEAEGMRYGGPVMAYADGGNVSMEEFQRMVGDIEGPGTEVSDDIPAMLSDGEFVMTGQAVRGAGAFEMKKDGGIITLEPLGEESREKGTKLMYDMMKLFRDFAGEPA